MSAGVVVAIVAAVVVIFILAFGILWWKGCLRKKSSLAKGNYKGITNCYYRMIMDLFARTQALLLLA